MAELKYEGIKIPNKIIIVERTYNEGISYKWNNQKVNQGYVVDSGNAKMLKTAKNWAEWTWYDESLLHQLNELARKHSNWNVWDNEENKALYEKLDKEYHDTKKRMEGIVHEYNNGTFELILDEAAGTSNQGGKLSFWNCLVKAPDGKMFLIGINSNLLLHLMMSNTFVNGACQSKIWLGRIKGNYVGAFTSNMEEYIQAIKDEHIRQEHKKQTSKHIPGDIVTNLNNEKYVYLGPIYKYYDFEPIYYGSDVYDVIIYNKPVLMHLYGYYSKDRDLHKYKSAIKLNKTKTKSFVTGHLDNVCSPLEYIDSINDGEYAPKKYDYHKYDYELASKQFADNSNLSKKEIVDYIVSTTSKYRHVSYRNIEANIELSD